MQSVSWNTDNTNTSHLALIPFQDIQLDCRVRGTFQPYAPDTRSSMPGKKLDRLWRKKITGNRQLEMLLCPRGETYLTVLGGPTSPLPRVAVGQSGFFGSNSGIGSSLDFSSWPLHGLFIL